ncbi:MAG: hypothetical protein ACFFCW_04575 [Candidatus Hodarchaeota archaeon]
MAECIIQNTPHDNQTHASADGKVSLRKFPYPYKAALAICSDIDETRTTEEFLEIQRFLCTKNTTSMGEGVGLEIGNSFYFYDDENCFSYFTHDERARRIIIDLIRAGYVDCLHSYGDTAINRDQILRALDVLYKSDCKLDVWVNHYGAPSNFGRKFEYMFGACQGDDPGSSVYHADATLDYGIRFVWVGATTRVLGQSPTNSSLSVSTVLDPKYPLLSSLSVLKEVRKKVLGQWGNERFIIHRQNQLMQVMQLEDGRRVHEFIRYCNHPVSVGQGATSRGLAYAISKRVLEKLKAAQGFMIVYAHFGKNSDCIQVIAQETQEALRNLEREYRDGDIYVTTTSKLLNYYRAREYLVWSHQQGGNQTRINIEHLDDPVFGQQSPTVDQLQGLTFYVQSGSNVDICLGGTGLRSIQRNRADDSGQESVTIPFVRPSFPY